jgi:hypothetical protein
LRDVLVLVPGKVVLGVTVGGKATTSSPITNGRESGCIVSFPRKRSSDVLNFFDVGVTNTASTVSSSQKAFFFSFHLSSGKRIGSLRESVDFLVVERRVLFSLGGVVELLVGPGIEGSCPLAVTLDEHLALAHADSCEAFFSPVSTPGVSEFPIFLSGFSIHTPTSETDGMVGLSVFGLSAEDTTSVVIEQLGGFDVAGNGSTLLNFVLHGGDHLGVCVSSD